MQCTNYITCSANLLKSKVLVNHNFYAPRAHEGQQGHITPFRALEQNW